MNVTPYGYENPTSGDLSKGLNGWMAQINFDITRLDGHTHNGIDSAQLNSTSLGTLTVVAPSGSWVSSTGGAGLPASGYMQTVTVPVPITEINQAIVKFIINTAGARQYQVLDLFYVRLTGITFKLYCSDNTLDVLCVFR